VTILRRVQEQGGKKGKKKNSREDSSATILPYRKKVKSGNETRSKFEREWQTRSKKRRLCTEV